MVKYVLCKAERNKLLYIKIVKGSFVVKKKLSVILALVLVLSAVLGAGAYQVKTGDETVVWQYCHDCRLDFKLTDDVYDENNHIICPSCNKNLTPDFKAYPVCDYCKAEFEFSLDYFLEFRRIDCPHCKKNLIPMLYDYKCLLCEKPFGMEDLEVDENSDIICPHCKEILQDEQCAFECQLCNENFEIDDVITTEDGAWLCPHCKGDIIPTLITLNCGCCNENIEITGNFFDVEYDGISCPKCDTYLVLNSEYYELSESCVLSDWAQNYICKARKRYILPKEMLDDNFCDAITREEFAAIMVEFYELIAYAYIDADISETPFTDCNPESPYSSYVAKAYKLGITNGTGETTFSPTENITREQLAAMLSRILELDTLDVETEYIFEDDSAISDYARHAVYTLYGAGIVQGIGEGIYAPQATATKEQAITMTLRIYELISSFGVG